MKYIKELHNILPINYNNREIKLINHSDINEYMNILLSDSFNKYLDFKFNKDISIDKLNSILYNFIVTYNLGLDVSGPARLICRDINNNRIIGGCTIFEVIDNTIELSYFLIDEYQHKNEAYIMMLNILNELYYSTIPFNKLKLVIQESNIASLKLGSKLNFNIAGYTKGKYCDNIIMTLERRNIK